VNRQLRFQFLDASHDENELDRGLNGILAIETRLGALH